MLRRVALIFFGKTLVAQAPPFGTRVWTAEGVEHGFRERERFEALKLVFLASLEDEYGEAAIREVFGRSDVSAEAFDRHWMLEIAWCGGDFSTELDELVLSSAIAQKLKSSSNPVVKEWVDARSSAKPSPPTDA